MRIVISEMVIPFRVMTNGHKLDAKDQVFATIKRQPGISRSNLREQLSSMSEQELSSALARLSSSKRIANLGNRRNSRWYAA